MSIPIYSLRKGVIVLSDFIPIVTVPKLHHICLFSAWKHAQGDCWTIFAAAVNYARKYISTLASGPNIVGKCTVLKVPWHLV